MYVLFYYLIRLNVYTHVVVVIHIINDWQCVSLQCLLVLDSSPLLIEVPS